MKEISLILKRLQRWAAGWILTCSGYKSIEWPRPQVDSKQTLDDSSWLCGNIVHFDLSSIISLHYGRSSGPDAHRPHCHFYYLWIWLIICRPAAGEAEIHKSTQKKNQHRGVIPLQLAAEKKRNQIIIFHMFNENKSRDDAAWNPKVSSLNWTFYWGSIRATWVNTAGGRGETHSKRPGDNYRLRKHTTE